MKLVIIFYFMYVCMCVCLYVMGVMNGMYAWMDDWRERGKDVYIYLFLCLFIYLLRCTQHIYSYTVSDKC